MVGTSWLVQHQDDPGLVIVDPRPPITYLQGHIPGAVNLPSWMVFDRTTLELLPVERLAGAFQDVGVGDDGMVVLYDSFDGQHAALLAWTLEFLGHPRVMLLSSFLEGWVKEGRQVFYRPVKPRAGTLSAKPNPDLRATLAEISIRRDLKFVDLRSREEFEGKPAEGLYTGHLPGAVSLPWTSLLGDNQPLRGFPELEMIISELGLSRDDQIVTYCGFGPRAAIGYIALQQLGFKHVKVHDGSFQRWARQKGPFPRDDCVATTWNMG